MKIIDRYIALQYAQTLCICLLCLVGLYVIFDVVSNLDEIGKVADQRGGVTHILLWHYLSHSLVFFDRISGMLILIAAMFTAVLLQRHNELTALMAAGVSRTRVVQPVIVASLVVVLFTALSREAIIPQFRDRLARSTKDLTGTKGTELQPRYDNQTDILLRGRRAYPVQRRIAEPNFRLPPSLSVYQNELVAANAYFLPAEKDRPAGYLLDDVSQPEGITQRPSLTENGQPVVITPPDAPWLEENQVFVVSGIDLELLAGGQAWREYSSTWTLIRALHNPSLDLGADVRVAVHRRIVQPLLDVNLLFLGLPLVLRREQKNVFAAIGLGGLVVAMFTLIVLTFGYLGGSYTISPALAAWAPLFVGVPAAVAMVDWLWD